MDASETARKALYPLIIASQTIPTTALAPLFVLWFGYTIWSKVLVTVLITFFPITITVFDGFRSEKTEMEELLLYTARIRADLFEIKDSGDAAVLFFSDQDGGTAVDHRSGDWRMAGRSERTRIFQPENDDPVRWSRCICTDSAPIGSGDGGNVGCLAA